MDMSLVFCFLTHSVYRLTTYNMRTTVDLENQSITAQLTESVSAHVIDKFPLGFSDKPATQFHRLFRRDKLTTSRNDMSYNADDNETS